MSKALYRTYRSKSLDTVIGQDHITQVLSRALQAGTTSHAYLFTGPRGVGKTSIARILAHEINQLPYTDETNHLDIIEIDAASNNGVEDVRDLRDKALIAPAQAAKKVYIIDEVHMLSKPAFNALLKILEEPPEHVVFIMATTDVDKLPATIISRTQRFHFRFVPETVVASHLQTIATQEGLTLDDAAATLIARQGGGSVRDSISLLDQLRHLSKTITVDTIQQQLGLAPDTTIDELIQALYNHDAKQIIQLLTDLNQHGVSAATIARQLGQALQNDLAQHPSYAATIEQLLEVGRSAHENVRLLVILLDGIPDATADRSRSAAASATTSTPSLEISATRSKRLTPPTTPAPKQAVATPTASPATHEGTVYLSEEKLDWQGLLAYAHDHDRIIFTMLNQCTPEVIDGTLVLYAGKKFHKTKLDDPKHRLKISQFIQAVGMGDILIETVGTPPVPRDARLAKIAELMGGGEEVDAE